MKRGSLAILLVAGLAATDASAAEPPWVERPQCGTIKAFGGLGEAFYHWGRAVYGVLTTITPDGGVRVDDQGQFYLTASWPLQIAFGTESGRQVLDFGDCAESYVEVYRAHRVVLEPILSATLHDDELDFAFDTRPAYRFLWHSGESDWGIGAGIGSTIQWLDGIRASVSPELLVQYGECCVPSYLTVSLRYDRFFAGDTVNLFGVSAGWTFW